MVVATSLELDTRQAEYHQRHAFRKYSLDYLTFCGIYSYKSKFHFFSKSFIIFNEFF
jgi:hypothetical protein